MQETLLESHLEELKKTVVSPNLSEPQLRAMLANTVDVLETTISLIRVMDTNINKIDELNEQLKKTLGFSC